MLTQLTRDLLNGVQTEDKFIDGIGVGKDRELYEPVVIPTAYLINGVGIGSTVVYVDNVKTLFDPHQENFGINNLDVTFITSSDAVGASATAVVSGLGSVTSIELSNVGSGYTSAPTVVIGSVGVGSTATATATVGAGGTLSISITNNGIGYTNTNPPQVIIEQPTGKLKALQQFHTRATMVKLLDLVQQLWVVMMSLSLTSSRTLHCKMRT